MKQNSYQKRRQRLLNEIGENGIIIIFTAPDNASLERRFHPDDDFYYLTGFDEPQAVMVLAGGGKYGDYMLFCRPHDKTDELWNGHRAGLDGAVSDFGADKAFAIDDIDDIMPQLIEGRDKIVTAIGRYPRFDRQLLSWLNKVKAGVRSGKQTPSQILDINASLHEHRLIKTAEELALMRQANTISIAGHKRAMQTCRPGMHEYQVQAELEAEFRLRGSHTNAYSSIVAGGRNACILHYSANNQALNDGELLLIDAGGKYQYYSSDITRTFPINGKFTAEQRTIYELVLKAQLAVMEKCKPNESWSTLQQTAVEVLTQGLLDLGLLKGELQQAIDNQSYTRFYMHLSGHWLGLNVHDVGSYYLGDTARKLKAGMAFTVEPGLYIAPSDDIDPRWHNIGIRIEDNIAVREGGHENLTAALPKTVDAIEALMAG